MGGADAGSNSRWGRLVSHHLLDEFDDERRWLRPPPRQRRRLLLGLSLVAASLLVWLGLGGRSEVPPPPDPGPPPRPTADQRALEAGRRALQAWGRFAVTNQLGTLGGWFWPNGPQYRQLAGEAKLRRGTKALGRPPTGSPSPESGSWLPRQGTGSFAGGCG